MSKYQSKVNNKAPRTTPILFRVLCANFEPVFVHNRISCKEYIDTSHSSTTFLEGTPN